MRGRSRYPRSLTATNAFVLKHVDFRVNANAPRRESRRRLHSGLPCVQWSFHDVVRMAHLLLHLAWWPRAERTSTGAGLPGNAAFTAEGHG